MKRTYIILGISLAFFLALGYYLGWLDNGPGHEMSIDVNNIPSRLDQ